MFELIEIKIFRKKRSGILKDFIISLVLPSITVNLSITVNDFYHFNEFLSIKVI